MVYYKKIRVESNFLPFLFGKLRNFPYLCHQLRKQLNIKTMVQDIVIRAEFLIEDLGNNITQNGVFHPNIIKVWKEDIRFVIQNGIDCENERVYDLYDKEDLKECLDMGMDAEDIAYLVNRYQTEEKNTQFFTYSGVSWHILNKQDVINAIQKQIEQIAYNILKYPYNSVYAELYREFVVPMIEQQVK